MPATKRVRLAHMTVLAVMLLASSPVGAQAPSIATVGLTAGASYDLLQAGALNQNMPEAGGREELAPYPDWTARYLVYKNVTQRSFVLANGDLSGSWPVHVREAEDSSNSGVGAERLISLNQRPTIWYDARAQGSGVDYVKGSPMPLVEYGSTIPGPGQTALIPDNAHQPSIAYVPYLLTGDRYYAEEMAFWANYAMLRTYNGDGVRGSQGILESNEVRGYGWALRNIVDAAAYYPDGSPVQAYLAQKVANNLQWLDTYANAQDPSTNPFQIMWTGKRPEGVQYIALWEQNYLAYAIDRANKQGFTGGLEHRDAIAKFQLKLFTSDPAYPRAQGAPYIVAVGTPSGSNLTFFTTMAQIWSGTQGNERPFAGYYGPPARLSLTMGVERGWPGAQEAYDYLWPFLATGNTYCAAFYPDKPDLACRAGWAVEIMAAGTATVFTDDPLTAGGTLIKALHITELRTAIAALRLRFVLPVFTWTDSLLNSATTVKVVHLTELRTALGDAYVAAGLPRPSFTDPTIVPGSTHMRIAHIKELRDAVTALESR